MERGYTERMARTQVLKARDESRDRFLERGNTKTSESKLSFYITMQRFRISEGILGEQILLAPDKEHKSFS